VKAYANVEGLAQALVSDGKLGDKGQMRAFVAEFTNRLPICEFVDVGHGKERADHKVKGEWWEWLQFDDTRD
jgi:hypothetical protein